MTNITAIVDLQFGSTGKGLIAGYLSQQNNYDRVVSANMPNAGHTFVDHAGKAWVNKVLPSGVYSKDLEFICIGPGAIFSAEQLSKEMYELRGRGCTASVVVHPNAALLFPEHTQAEQALSKIASTMQGSMEAMVTKLRRGSGGLTNVVGDLVNQQHQVFQRGQFGTSVATHEEWFNIMDSGKEILVEGSQGYSLGINSGFYPYTTSRDCSVWRLISDAGVTVKNKMTVIGSSRLHPIRVGNTPDGFSGGLYRDQRETSWEELGVPPEYTTVTKRERRVFTFSLQQIREAIIANRVDQVFLNFCNYDTREALRVKNLINCLVPEIDAGRGIPDWIRSHGIVRYMGFGPRAEDILELHNG